MVWLDDTTSFIVADNRNRTDVSVAVTLYLIGKNPKGEYKLLKTESNSVTMKKLSRKNQLLNTSHSYTDYGSRSRNRSTRNFLGIIRIPTAEPSKDTKLKNYEYKGYLVVVKGEDGKVVSADGDFAKFYKFIESKRVGDTFNSKGEKKEEN